MQLFQLITTVGLTLSHVRAAPPVIPDRDAQLVEQVVTLITRPDIIINNTPELKSFQGFASQSPSLFDNQIHQGAAEAFSSLRTVGDDHSAYVFHSIAGYHSTADPKRSEIYRNSLYSRLVDLTYANPKAANEHLQMAYKRLLASLKVQLSNLEERQLAPMGNHEVIAKLEKLFTRFADENKDEIHKYTQTLLSKLPSSHTFSEMKYLTREQVNSELLATNANNAHPAMLIDGFASYFKSLQRIHAPPAHKAANPVVAHSPQPVAATA